MSCADGTWDFIGINVTHRLIICASVRHTRFIKRTGKLGNRCQIIFPPPRQERKTLLNYIRRDVLNKIYIQSVIPYERGGLKSLAKSYRTLVGYDGSGGSFVTRPFHCFCRRSGPEIHSNWSPLLGKMNLQSYLICGLLVIMSGLWLFIFMYFFLLSFYRKK